MAVKDVSGKIAAMLGTNARQLAINDLAVNPRSGNVYLAVSRGRGPDAVSAFDAREVAPTARSKRSRSIVFRLPRPRFRVPRNPSAAAAGGRRQPAQPVDHRPGLLPTDASFWPGFRTKSSRRD